MVQWYLTAQPFVIPSLFKVTHYNFLVETFMLQLRPNCEFCDKDLPPDAVDACICSYECTFCRSCVETILKNVCPNCGGGFVARPIRPATEYRPGVSASQDPPSGVRVHAKFTEQQIAEFAYKIKDIAPEKR